MKKILIQLDTDPQPSSFDRVVAVDSGVDELLSYGGVAPADVEALVHGALFTRAPNELKNTAIFVGGSDVEAGERVAESVLQTFFGPMRVSVMLDSNGSNTTAAAAVLCARRHLDLSQSTTLVLGGTGPVGQRAAQLLAKHGARVRVASRSLQRAQATCNSIAQKVDGSRLAPVSTADASSLQEALEGVELIIAAGAAGVQLLSTDELQQVQTLKVAVDLNAVPPAGLDGIEVMDKATPRNNLICYGAIGVGSRKMKIHKTALSRLFDSNAQVRDTEAIYEIGSEL
jgi:predicted dinucleotide-binding enzyme